MSDYISQTITVSSCRGGGGGGHMKEDLWGPGCWYGEPTKLGETKQTSRKFGYAWTQEGRQYDRYCADTPMKGQGNKIDQVKDGTLRRKKKPTGLYVPSVLVIL